MERLEVSPDAGSTFPAVVVLVIGAVLTVSLAIEVGRFTAAVRHTGYAADLAAEAAGSGVDESLLLATGEIALDAGLAASLAREISRDLLKPYGHDIAITMEDGGVCVEVSRRYRPSLLPLPAVPIAADACAAPASG